MKAPFLIGILFLGLLSCSSPAKPDQEKVQVSVSILPQQYFVDRIAGDRVQVNVMVPPGASPATYEPTASQLARLEESSLYLSMGYLGFERSWMDKLSSVNANMKIIDLSSGIELISGEEENKGQNNHTHGHGNPGHRHDTGIDPHTWMSPANVGIMSRQIHEVLCEILPDHQQEFSRNLELFLAETDSLDRVIRQMFSGIRNRTFMIYHPALAYLARDYELTQLSLESEGKEPSPLHMKKMADLGKELGIQTIFIQKEFDRRNATVLAEEIGARVMEINPLDPDWPAQIIYISNALSTLN